MAVRMTCSCCGEKISASAWEYTKWLRAYADAHEFDETDWAKIPAIHRVALQREARERGFHLSNTGVFMELDHHPPQAA